ncbi:MAG: YkgJ family cysteine cluster protein [Pseudomonadota bacterium]
MKGESTYFEKLLKILKDKKETDDKYHKSYLKILKKESNLPKKVLKENPCFKCKARCCMHKNVAYIPLYLVDVAHFLDNSLLKHFQLYDEYHNYYSQGVCMLKLPKRGHCNLLDKEKYRCSIQGIKPLLCFAWPYVFDYSKKGILIAAHCEQYGLDFSTKQNRLRFSEIAYITSKMVENEETLFYKYSDDLIKSGLISMKRKRKSAAK